MSFSNDFVDKSPETSVLDHRKAVQISEQDALRLQVANLRHDEGRRACARRIQRAEDYPHVAENFLGRDENGYVKEHLKLGYDLTLSYGPEERSLEQIKRTGERLWSDVQERVDTAKQREKAGEPSKAGFFLRNARHGS
ncbi:hypothetical protein [uncultured Roseobacter sp.]|uniref:hypothetical protein n=1 Tax=uncultured Roseobacter sp. TaxID=114847 RepID=UPI002604C5D0|nr:hypothetical protein [uncultured Roseobacter sp.]